MSARFSAMAPGSAVQLLLWLTDWPILVFFDSMSAISSRFASATSHTSARSRPELPNRYMSTMIRPSGSASKSFDKAAAAGGRGRERGSR